MSIEQERTIFLTNRQVEILKLRASGVPLKCIAIDLGRDPKTVWGHWSQIIARTGINDPVLLTQFAIDHGLIKRKRWPNTRIVVTNNKRPFERT